MLRVVGPGQPVSSLRFAVVVPAFDEAANVPELVRSLREVFEANGLQDGEVILVDDGSTDGTGELAKTAAADWPALRVVRHHRNLGKTEALLSAANATDAEYLVLFDADLQHRAEEIPRFLEKLAEGWDLVTARKIGAYAKQTVSSVYNRLSQTLFRVPVSDLNSMKAFRREILDEVHLRHDWHRFFVVLAYAKGRSITEIDVPLFPRMHGRSKYEGFGRVVTSVFDLLAVASFLSLSRRPLLFFAGTGVLLAVLGVLVGVTTIGLRISGQLPPFGLRPLLYLVMLLETLGFLLFGFGFVIEALTQQRAELDALRDRVLPRGRRGSPSTAPRPPAAKKD